MTLKDQLHPSLVALDGGINFRDMGGNRAADGRLIKPGYLFRSGALDQLTDADCHRLNTLAIVNILDYRDPDEVQQKPDVVWAGANYIHVPANPLSDKVNGNLEKLTSNDNNLRAFNGREFMLELYRLLPFNNPAYRRLASLLEAPAEGGLVQHCAVGKDRTGVGSALILFALGADKNTVMEDYLLTEMTLAPFRQKMLTQLSQKLDEHALEQFGYVMSAREEFLSTALSVIEERYGSTDNWLEQEFSLTSQRREALYARYLAE